MRHRLAVLQNNRQWVLNGGKSDGFCLKITFIINPTAFLLSFYPSLLYSNAVRTKTSNQAPILLELLPNTIYR